MSVPHRAPLAAPEGYAGPRRALILAGGGMRVSWQAGVLRALEEAGIVFTHGDGTSGGIMNLAALLSGVPPAELCERWRALEPRHFSSFASLPDLLRLSGPVAMGDADGVVGEVFPRLGIDLERVRSASGIESRFNVCDFGRKTVEPIPHREVRVEHLVAGMSLPIFMPAVQCDGKTYTDAVWIKDANLIDAVRRGAQELWLVWCIGNTPEYRNGPFDQYVHMIEMSANGGLTEEFDRIREINERIRAGEPVYGHTQPITLHVVRPETALPLDPAYFFGQITANDLIELGHEAARRYLRRMSPDGVPFEPETMIMSTPAAGISFRETMKGPFSLSVTEPREGAEIGARAGTELAIHVTVTVRDLDRFTSDPQHRGTLSGTVDFSPLGTAMPSGEGTFQLFSPGGDPRTKRMVYELPFEHGGQHYYLAGYKEVRDDPGMDLWTDTTTLFTRLFLGDSVAGTPLGAGVLRLGAAEFGKVAASVRALDASSPAESAKLIAQFGRFFAGELWDSYAPAARAE